jgi:hypothetical protein
MSQVYYDISGLFNIQKDIILNPNIASNPNIGVINKNISTSLDSIYNDYQTTNKTINDTLEHQQQMLSIVQTEKERLDMKKDEIDSAYTGKQRGVILNESYSLRYKQILKIILVIIVTLILFIIIIFISKRFTFLPASIFELLSIIVVSSGIIIVYYLTISLLSRSRVYYNELNLPPPGPVGNTLPTSSNSSEYNKLFKDLTNQIDTNMCIGSSCCADGTRWDSGNSTCVGNTISSFTTIDLSQIKGEFNGSVKPNSPNEFSEYTLVR